MTLWVVWGVWVDTLYIVVAFGGNHPNDSNCSGGFGNSLGCRTLPETNMETQKGPYKDYSPSKRGLYGFPC